MVFITSVKIDTLVESLKRIGRTLSPQTLPTENSHFRASNKHFFPRGELPHPLLSNLCHLVKITSGVGETYRTPIVLDLLEKMLFITSLKIDIFCFFWGETPFPPFYYRYELFQGQTNLT